MLFQGGLHPDLKIEWYEDLLRAIKAKFNIWCHCFSAPEITNIAEVSGLVAARHHRPAARRGSRFHPRRRRGDSGRRRAPPHQPAEMRHPGMDRRASHRARARHAHHGHHDVRLRRNHRTAHESLRYRAADPGRHRRIHGVHPLGVPARELTSLGRFIKEEATAVEYLKTLAISRIYLDNIENIQSSWVTPGLKICQLGLRFGGNDVGSIMIEENVVSAAGTHHQATEEELRA